MESACSAAWQQEFQIKQLENEFKGYMKEGGLRRRYTWGGLPFFTVRQGSELRFSKSFEKFSKRKLFG